MGVIAVFETGVRSHAQLKDKEVNGIIDHADGSITTEKIRDGAITSVKIADGAVTTEKLAALDRVDLVPRVDDPALVAGRVWLRGDLGRLLYSPDGTTVLRLAPSPIGTDDIADRAVTRAKLEYPTENVSFAYLAVIDKVLHCSIATWGACELAREAFADKAVYAAVQSNSYPALVARLSDYRNAYYNYYNPGATTADHVLAKIVAGSATSLASEAIDIDNKGRGLAISCVGSTIKSMRFEMTSPIDPLSPPTPNYTLSVTDTSLASGYFGHRFLRETYPHGAPVPSSVYLKPPMSPSPKPIAYLEVPVVGSGTEDDPFRAQVPEEIVWEWSLNPRAKRKYDILKARGFTDEEIIELLPEVLSARVNRLALTHSSLIKTDRATGKPTEYVAIVRVFEQPGRPAYLYPIDRALEALKSMPGVRVLSREEAIRRAKQIDPDLTDVDLLPIPSTGPRFKQILKDYIAHRIAMGVREELIDEKLMERYLQEDKGW